MIVASPADDVEAKAMVKAAYDHYGPVYMRFGRAAVPVINDEANYTFEFGKGIVMKDGTDVTIIANGLCVAESLEAAEKLAADGINAKVINMHTIKPLDTELVIESAKATGKVVTVEEHSIIGGLGGAVCECLAEANPVPVKRIGINDVYGESGSAAQLIKKYGLDAEAIYNVVKEFCKYLPSKIKEYNDVFTNNIITRKRMFDVGILSREDAISYGCTGGTGRASGWACDVRKRHPYALYDKVDFKEIIYTKGDSFERFLVRIDEIKESLRIIEQLIDNIPEGDYKVKTKPIIRLPEGSYHAAVEGSRGEFGVFIESRGEKSPYRIKFRPMGLPLVASMGTMLKGCKIADLMTIGATLDYVIPDIDR